MVFSHDWAEDGHLLSCLEGYTAIVTPPLELKSSTPVALPYSWATGRCCRRPQWPHRS